MAVLRAFKAIRPIKDLAHKVAALPYDVLNSEEAKAIASNNPYSFLHIDKAEIDFQEDIYIYDKRVYEKARDNLNDFIKKGIFIEENKPCLYLYRLTMEGRSQIGIVGCTSIDDYLNNIIKKHEHTRQDKEEDRINHVDYCNANTGPIFLTYKDNEEINDIVDKWTKKSPLYDFTSDDNIKHTVWVIDDDTTICKLIDLFSKINNIYIADGHHRAASAVKVGLKRRSENANYNKDAEFNYFLSVLFPSSHLYIMDYNRVVKDLNGLSIDEFLNMVTGKFYITLYEKSEPFKPQEKHTFGMYINNKWFILKAKEGTFDESNPIEKLDVSILQNNLLRPILGIDDPRTSDRIDFIGGIRGLKELEKKANKFNGVAFSMYPTTIDDLMDIADVGEVMPPKSTWFEPKLRSGLFIHKL
ncbi:DUF1015 domain-containing protein [Caloramator sp. E03]|uniref:DUF1015 domain-containing protein n=1 Tax=Caloramator sp. E03 TaxID=2576307 RepID=UPI0011104AD5|nr:DUF1015 family protein [Caloramator sp. E03]QCX34525.1 DUF1015 domain-containing protein [Caloramator sp. E03]